MKRKKYTWRGVRYNKREYHELISRYPHPYELTPLEVIQAELNVKALTKGYRTIDELPDEIKRELEVERREPCTTS